MSRVLSTRSSRIRLLKAIGYATLVVYLIFALYGARTQATVSMFDLTPMQHAAIIAYMSLYAFATIAVVAYVASRIENWVNSGSADVPTETPMQDASMPAS